MIAPTNLKPGHNHEFLRRSCVFTTILMIIILDSRKFIFHRADSIENWNRICRRWNILLYFGTAVKVLLGVQVKYIGVMRACVCFNVFVNCAIFVSNDCFLLNGLNVLQCFGLVLSFAEGPLDHFAACWDGLGSLGGLGASWGALGAVLGPLERILRASCGLLGTSWADLGRFQKGSWTRCYTRAIF